MNFWDAKLPQHGVATGDFARAKRGDRFLYANPYINKIEYFRFRDPYGNGVFWYYPIDGTTTNDFWWERIQVQ